MFAWQATVQDESGNAVPLPVVTVYEADGTTIAKIYDSAGISIDNPLVGDVSGFVQFYVSGGKYKVEGFNSGSYTNEWELDTGPSSYPSRDDLVLASSRGLSYADGSSLSAGGNEYVYRTGSSILPDLPDFIPDVGENAFHYGAVGNGAYNNNTAFSAMASRDTLTYIQNTGAYYKQSSALTRPFSGSILPDPSISWRHLTDDGKFNWARDHFTRIWDVGQRGASVWRFSDRVFVAGAAVNMAGDLDGVDAGNSWATVKSEAADYLPILAKHLVISNDGKVAYNASVRTSDNQPTHFMGIGYGANIINDKVGSGAWGGIFEMQHEEGVWTCGWEIVMKNKSGDNLTLSPYYRSLGTPGGGDFGFWLIAGGDNAFGGSANAPSNSAIAINRNQSAGNAVSCWNNGIVFEAGSLSGTDGSATDTGFGRAIVMARRHALIWETPDGTGRGARIMGSVTTQAKQVAIDMSDDQIVFGGNTGPMLRVRHVAGGVNYIDVNNNTSTGSPKMKAAGSGDIDIQIEGLGAGGVRLNGSDGIPKVRVDSNGVGFFNSIPVSKRTLPSAATDATSTQALVNSIRNALISYGLAQ